MANGLEDATALMARLDGTNEDNIRQSRFRRGLQRLEIPLDYAKSCLNVLTPVATIDPIAGQAFGIVQSVLTVRSTDLFLKENND
jgi:hypothetical protein